MTAGQQSPFQSSPQLMVQPDQGQQSLMPFREVNHPGVALQPVAECVECPQPLFRLADEVGIVLKHLKTQRVVDVADGNALLLQSLP